MSAGAGSDGSEGAAGAGWPVGWKLLLWLALTIVLLGALWLLGVTAWGSGRRPLGSVVAVLAASLAAGWILLALEGRGPGALGFGLRTGAVRETALGFALGMALLVPLFALLLVTGDLEWRGDGGGWGPWTVLGAESLAFLGLAAASEEAFVRGYPFQLMAGRWGPGPSLAVTSGIFGALHLGNPAVGWLAAVNVGLAGLLLGVLVLRTGSLWWATGAHLGWNWGQAFLADLPVSGLDVVDTPLWEGVLSGPRWLSGGAFGVEGSVLTAGVMAGAAAVCWRWDRLGPVAPRWWRDEDDTKPGGTAAGHERDKESEA